MTNVELSIKKTIVANYLHLINIKNTVVISSTVFLEKTQNVQFSVDQKS
jgi:hypothetical protein